MVDFTHPWFLWLAPVVVVWLVVILRGSWFEMTPRQRAACLAVRAALLLCLVLALAGTRWRRVDRGVGTIFLVDDSLSVSAEGRAQARAYVERSLAARRRGDVAGVVGFGRRAAVWQPAAPGGARAARWPELAAADRLGTDLGRALDFAGAILPADKAARRVVLLSDGNDTVGGGRARAAAARLAAAGAELLTVPLGGSEAPEVLVRQLEPPRSVQPGEPFDLRAVVESNVATTARVVLYQDHFLAGEQPAVALRPGANEVLFHNLQAAGGFTNFECEVIPARDTRLENNRAEALVTVAGPPRVLLVEGEENRAGPLVDALRAARVEVEPRGPLGLPRSLDELQRFDLFLLSDVSALSLDRAQMELYRQWVAELGGGFALLGGENSFGVGGYYQTPVEQMLPVRMEHDDREETPNVALYVVLDRSGSMSAQIGGQTKIALADQGALLALNVLQPRDLFGLSAVDTRVNPIVPLSRVGDLAKAAVGERVASLTAGGGGIYIYTSLVDAARVLRDAGAKIKHCILFSDAADAEEKNAGEMSDGTAGNGTSVDVVASMLANKITTSVVGLGGEHDKDVNFLRLLAETGNGRFYLTDDARNLPQIFSTETMKVSQSSLVEEPFQARPALPSPLTAGIDWGTAPLLLGFNATKPKPTGEVVLTTETGEPLLATWRYGLGQTAAFTSDAKARWAAEWVGWPGYGKFWAQLVRTLLRRRERTGLQARLREVDEDHLRVEVDAVSPEGRYLDGLPVVVRAVDAATGQEVAGAVPAEQVGPGAYRAVLALPARPLPGGAAGGNGNGGGDSKGDGNGGGGGSKGDAAEGAAAPETADAEPPGSRSLLVTVASPAQPERPLVVGYARGYPKEFLRFRTDEATLRELAAAGGGAFAPAPEAAFRPPDPAAVRLAGRGRPTDLANGWLALALLLLPVDVFLRRREWRGPPAGPADRKISSLQPSHRGSR